VVLIVLALCGVAFLAVPGSPAHRSLKQGLDLQGGLEYVLKAQPPKGVKLTAADLDRSVTIMRNRVDKLGVSEPIITKQGTDQISIQLAGVHNVNQAANIIGSTAQLELYDLEPALSAPSTSASGPVATRSLYGLLSHVPEYLRRNLKGRTPAELMFHVFLAMLTDDELSGLLAGHRALRAARVTFAKAMGAAK